MAQIMEADSIKACHLAYCVPRPLKVRAGLSCLFAGYDVGIAVNPEQGGQDRCSRTARFSAMVTHFLFEAEFCNPASRWEKGQIEKNVQDARHRLWQPTPSFPSLMALDDWLEARCRELWAHIGQPS